MEIKAISIVHFWKRVNKSNGCWEWTGAKDNGYGKMQIGNRYRLATHVSLIISGKEVPKGMVVCHHCDNPGCVRPDHLFIGTRSENGRDKVSKNRQSRSSKRLSENEAKSIRNSRLPRSLLSMKFGVSIQTIDSVRAGRSWRSLQ